MAVRHNEVISSRVILCNLGKEPLEFFASFYRITGARRRQVVGDVLALTDLEYKRSALIDSLSRGMQQRLGLARVLLHDP